MSRTHSKTPMYFDDPLKRDFYIELCRLERWSSRYLAKHEQKVDEQTPIGIILCAGKKQEQFELLELGKSGIDVAEYLTVLPPREALQAKLHQSIEVARSRLRDDRDGD
ncbi:hypothetical protein OKW32_005459 [Paraburkholderia youngii]